MAVSKLGKFYSSDEVARCKSVDVAIDLVKQQITLSSVLIGLALAFTHGKNLSHEFLLKGSIGLLSLSFVLGIVTISCFSTAIRRNNVENIFRLKRVRIPGTIQGFTFITGVLAIATFIFFEI